MSEAPPDTPLDRARALIARMTPELGSSVRRLAELLRQGCRHTPPIPKVKADFDTDAEGLVFALRLARSALSEEAVEKLARELAWQLGDTMGDAHGVFLSSAMHTDGERWRKAARAVLTALVEMAEPQPKQETL